MSMFRSLIDSRIRLSRKFDSLLPARLQQDGNRHFLDEIVPAYLTPGALLVDVGGGKQPYLGAEAKESLSMSVIGFDISQRELDSAPSGTYDRTICADISTYRGDVQADTIICQSLLEHVRDVEGAMAALAGMLTPGGRLLVFVPSRNALFARLNLLLPQRMKEALLFTIFPHTRHAQGFPSYYDNCTPNDFIRFAAQNKLTVVDAHYYYMSAYFTFLVPLHVLWRAYSSLARVLLGKQAAETFSFVLEKRAE